MKPIRFFLAFIFTVSCAACGFRQTAENTNAGAPPISGETRTGIPFESKEPETFQTEIVITNFSDGEKIVKNYFVARSAGKSLTVFNRGEKSEHRVLTDRAKTFFLDDKTKSFRETTNVSNDVSPPDEMLEFLTIRWLNRKIGAVFEKLETENNLTNYRVRPEDSGASEIIVTYDETVKLPVRQEFYSISGGEKILTMTVELKNFKASADEKLFVLPQDYKRAETR